MTQRILIACLIVANFLTAGIGTPLPGLEKLSVSNLPPLIFLAISGILFLASREKISRNIVTFFVAFNASVLASFLIFLIRDQWKPNLIVLLFQDIELMFCLLLYWSERNDPIAFRNAVRIGLYVGVPVAAFFGLQDFRNNITLIMFGMDDKSHAAVLLSMASFLLARFFQDAASRATSIALLLMALLTVSRLPVLFVPAIALALIAGSKHRTGLLLSAGIGLALLVRTYGYLLLDTFSVAQRLSSIDRISSEGSTSAHLMLLKTAWDLKLADPWSFFFGIGPSNFSKALTSNSDLLYRMGAIDPLVALDALQSASAPVHSTQLALFLDYGIWLPLLYFLLLLKSQYYLWVRRRHIDLLFSAAVFVSSLFYSLHNKPYFFLYLTCYGLLVLREDTEARRAPSNTRLRPTSLLSA